MRRLAKIQANGDIEVLKTLYGRVIQNAVEGSIVGNLLTVKIYEDTVDYNILIDGLKERNIKYSFSESREYTKDEMKNAEFYNISIVYPWEAEGVTADEFGTQYSNNSDCNKCGIGKQQISDLVIDKKKMAKYDIATIMPEIIINEKLYQLITESNLTGFEFRSVRDVKGKEEPILYQLVIESILPKMNKEIKIEIDKLTYCSECEMHGVFLRSELVYDREALIDARDFNVTYEYFGMRAYCTRQIVVSAKVRDLFMKHKVKRVAFEPIRISAKETSGAAGKCRIV